MLRLVAIAGAIGDPAQAAAVAHAHREGPPAAGHARNKQGCLPNHGADFGQEPGLLGRAKPARQMAEAGGDRRRWGVFVAAVHRSTASSQLPRGPGLATVAAPNGPHYITPDKQSQL